VPSQEVVGVIPARYGSTRFPGKPLADIAGKSLIQRVWEQAVQCKLLDSVLVATDDERILNHVIGFGGAARLTGGNHASGTDRLGEIANLVPAGYYVNIQGDEPLLMPQAIDGLVGGTVAEKATMSTLVSVIRPSSGQLDNPSVVKVVCDLNGYAMYFSRSPIPFNRAGGEIEYYKHIGIYMYTGETLARLCQTPRSKLEQAESLEQLRALETGIKIRCFVTDYDPVGVDTPEDAELAATRLMEMGQ